MAKRLLRGLRRALNSSTDESETRGHKLVDGSGEIQEYVVLRRQLSFDFTIDRNGIIHRIPEEMLLNILAFVSGSDLLNRCSVVCKYWYSIMNDDAIWRLKCQKEGILWPQKGLDGNQLPFDYCQIYFKRPFNRNLIKNWNAANNLQFWTIIENSGNRFAIEPDKCHYADPVSSIGIQGCSHCWVTSYGWCKKTQLVDLVAEGCNETIIDSFRPKIEISDWAAARLDCASKYTLEVRLLSASKDVIDQFETHKQWQQWQDNKWHKFTHTFSDYPAGVRYVQVTHAGKDSQFWAGHYGPKITATSVRLKI